MLPGLAANPGRLNGTDVDPLWPRVEELFHSALEQPELERETWLASQTGFAPEVRDEVRSLLAADRRHCALSAQTPA